MASATHTEDMTRALVYMNGSIWIISNLVLVPFESYYAYKIYENRDSLIIAKRKPGILVLCVTASILFYFLFQTLLFVLSLEEISVISSIGTIAYCSILPAWWISWFTQIARLWLLFYTIQHSVAIMNSEWQEVINPKHTEENWYIKHKVIWGTWKGLKLKIILYTLCTYCVDILFSALWVHYDGDDDALERAIVVFTVGATRVIFTTICPLAFLIWIASKIPNFHDNIGLGEELKYCLAGYCILIVIAAVESIAMGALETDQATASADIAIAIQFFLWKLVSFAINLKQTRWPLKRFEKVLRRYSTRQAAMLTHQKTLDHVESVNQSSKNDALGMKQILQSAKSFDLFMQHCSSEHCTECVLSMIEFTQFKNTIFQEISSNGRNTSIASQHESQMDAFILPEKCPKSHIIDSNGNNYKLIARELWKKYIEVGSEWEINIDYITRRKYHRLFENEDNWINNKKYAEDHNLYELFDKCLQEMKNLVGAAFSRYKQTKRFLVMQKKSKSISKGMEQSLPEDDEELISPTSSIRSLS